MRILAGMYADQETGLYYWYSRYYDPKTGRGISADRMSVAEHVQEWRTNMGKLNQPPLELNPYAYVANNPLRWTDPLGLAVQVCSRLWTPHTFLCVDGNCSGKYPSGNPFGSPGVIRDNSGDKSSASCSNVPSGKCDQNSFEQCVAKRLANRGPSGDLYNYSSANCGEWVEDVIMQCRN